MQHQKNQLLETTLVIGLGNPWEEYKDTRHNIGAQAVTHIARANKLSFNTFKGSWIAQGTLAGQDIILARSNSNINNSGDMVEVCMEAFGRHYGHNLWVLHDDISFDLGIIRIKLGGGSGRHRGLQSVIDKLGTEDFVRIRIGVGYPSSGKIRDYVLNSFSEGEKMIVERILELVRGAIETGILEGIRSAQNNYHPMDMQSNET